MTTSVKVKPHNYPVEVTITDRWLHHGQASITETSEYIKAGEEKEYHCTTSRTISVVDVDYNVVEGSYEAAYPKQQDLEIK